jgi:hypothetical protein
LITPDLFEPSLEHFRMPEYACGVVEEELGQSSHTVALYEGTIFQSKIAEWSYYLGCGSAAVAIVYRALCGREVFSRSARGFRART